MNPSMATCHPDRKHFGRGLCRSCWTKETKVNYEKPDKSPGAKRVAERLRKAIDGTGPLLCKHKDRQNHKAGVCEECYNDNQKKKAGQYNSEVGLKHYIKKRYGITLDHLNKLYYEQDGMCAVCGAEGSIGIGAGQNKRLHIDHDHASGIIRGLLCHRCNRGLGCFMDDISVLASAIIYLNKNRKEAGDV